MQLEEIVKTRRSAMNFDESVEISTKELEDLFNLTKFYPSCYNLQHAHYLAVTSREVRADLMRLFFNQYKLKTASAVVFVFGNVDAYRDYDRLYTPMKFLKIIDDLEFDSGLQAVNGMYEGFGEGFMRDEAIRNASLSAMQFMLIAKDRGWDTCPMHCFDSSELRELFNVPTNLIPVLMIALGKEDTKKQRPRGYRKPLGEFVTFETF